MSRPVAVIVAGALLFAPALSLAHLMPEDNGSTKVVGNRAYTLVSVPLAALSGFDDDRDGALSAAESRAHGDSIHAQIERRVQLYSEGVAGVTVYHDLEVPHFDSTSTVQSTSVVQIRVSQWTVPPKAITVRADIFTRKHKELTFRAIIGDSTETATLSARRPHYNFFMGPNANDTGGADLGAMTGLAGVAAALLATAILLRRKRQSVASSLSSAA